MDLPDIAIPEGGGKRRKLSSSSPKRVESDRSTVAPSEMVVNGPGTADEFPAPANRGDVNEKGKTYDMDWSAMGGDEVKYQ